MYYKNWNESWSWTASIDWCVVFSLNWRFPSRRFLNRRCSVAIKKHRSVVVMFQHLLMRAQYFDHCYNNWVAIWQSTHYAEWFQECSQSHWAQGQHFVGAVTHEELIQDAIGDAYFLSSRSRLCLCDHWASTPQLPETLPVKWVHTKNNEINRRCFVQQRRIAVCCDVAHDVHPLSPANTNLRDYYASLQFLNCKTKTTSFLIDSPFTLTSVRTSIPCRSVETEGFGAL